MYPGYVGYKNKQQQTAYASSAYVHQSAEQSEKWGAAVMGAPANPSAHPDNRQAAASIRSDSLPVYGTPVSYANAAAAPYPGAYTFNGQPFAVNTGATSYHSGGSYVRADPAPVKGPMDSVLQNLGKLGKKAEVFAGNVWGHLKTSPSLSDAAWGKLNHGTKLLCEGGLENIFRTNFEVAPYEQLRKSYACYLSTSTGPVAGTLFISTYKVAFCSDRPLPLVSSTGKQAWSYYKVVIPLECLKAVKPSANAERPVERYIQIVTVDDHEFWFMGFVNYDKGLYNLQQAVPLRGSQ